MNLNRIPFVKQLLGRLDREVYTFGLQGAVRIWLKNTGNRLTAINLDERTRNILENEPVLISLNHPHEAETYALLATLPKREDCFLIVNSDCLGIIPSMDKYFIPVYVKHHQRDNIKNRRKLSAVITEKFSLDELNDAGCEHDKNVKSINTAAGKIRNGGVVIICPEKHDSEKEWFCGVGYLANGAGLKKRVYYMKTFVKGTSKWDYLRYVPGVAKIMPKAKIYFSKPEILAEKVKEDPKETAKNLALEYYKWTEDLN